MLPSKAPTASYSSIPALVHDVPMRARGGTRHNRFVITPTSEQGTSRSNALMVGELGSIQMVIPALRTDEIAAHVTRLRLGVLRGQPCHNVAGDEAGDRRLTVMPSWSKLGADTRHRSRAGRIPERGRKR